jgi:hypothetical protein
MEGRLPPDDDDLFEWTDSPARPTPEEGTGERDRLGTGEGEAISTPAEPGTGEERRARPDTGSRRAVVRETGSFQAIREGIAERRRERGDTGEFERSGRRPPPGRRTRRRDLPARVRRRQDFMIGGAALVAFIALIVAISSGGGGGGEQPVPLKRLVGQTIVAKLGKKGADQDLLKRVRKGRVGGVIAFPRNAQSMRSDIQEVQAAAKQGDNPPLLVMIDQEGGDVKRLPEGPPDVSPQQLGAGG